MRTGSSEVDATDANRSDRSSWVTEGSEEMAAVRRHDGDGNH